MKMLAVNVGNSGVAFGIFEDGRLTQGERHRLSNNQAELIETAQVWGQMAVGPDCPSVLASVNPDDIRKDKQVKEAYLGGSVVRTE